MQLQGCDFYYYMYVRASARRVRQGVTQYFKALNFDDTLSIKVGKYGIDNNSQPGNNQQYFPTSIEKSDRHYVNII